MGKMSDEDRRNFEFEMTQDESLSEMVLAQKKILGVFQEKKTITFKEKLEGIRARRNEDVKKNPTPVFSIRRVLAIAASVLVLIGAGFYLFNFSADSHQDYSTYFELEPTFGKQEIGVLKSRGNDNVVVAEGAWNDFLEALQHKDSENALSLLQTFETNNSSFSENINTDFYRGMIAYQSLDFKLASNYFDGVETNSRYYPDALWFLSGIAFKQKENQKAQKLLKQLIELNKGDKIHLAKELLNK